MSDAHRSVPDPTRPRVLILGCGDTGRRVARHYLDRGHAVLGVVRTEASQQALATAGVPALTLDLTDGDLSRLPLADSWIFHFAPPPAEGVEDWLTRRLVAACSRGTPPQRLVYLSTTGVYGDCAGDWVDETWPVRPIADRARRRWDAEQSLRRWSREQGTSLVILRVAGIYGPGRLPIERIRQGLPLVREAEAPYSNRIHIEDLVQASLAAMARGTDGGVYNVCDDHPSTMTDYFFQIADAAGLPRPPEIPLADMDGQLSPGMRSYMSESRRLSNRRLREELGVVLTYPTLREGLAASI